MFASVFILFVFFSFLFSFHFLFCKTKKSSLYPPPQQTLQWYANEHQWTVKRAPVSFAVLFSVYHVLNICWYAFYGSVCMCYHEYFCRKIYLFPKLKFVQLHTEHPDCCCCFSVAFCHIWHMVFTCARMKERRTKQKKKELSKKKKMNHKYLSPQTHVMSVLQQPSEIEKAYMDGRERKKQKKKKIRTFSSFRWQIDWVHWWEFHTNMPWRTEKQIDDSNSIEFFFRQKQNERNSFPWVFHSFFLSFAMR